LNVYHDQTSPLITYYSDWAETDEDKAPKYVKVAGTGSVEDIKFRMLESLT